jgi:signal transduction histidine kinase
VVYVRSGDELLPVAREPVDDAVVAPIHMADLDAALAAFSLSQRVERGGEVLGAVAVTLPPGRPVRPAERRLVGQLAAQAALSFETLRLTAELTQKAEELQHSRRRLLQVQDAERERIGRDLHDGAQQHLVALLAKAGLVRSQLNRDPALADATVLELQQDTKAALTEIRELVHGIFPPILADRGLVVAVQQRTARLPVPVEVEAAPADVGRRFPTEIEGTAWFVVSETLTNVLKHARAERVCIRLCSGDDDLVVEVEDDGIGRRDAPRGHGLTNMADRVAALGGALTVEDVPGGGTLVRGTFPLTIAVAP